MPDAFTHDVFLSPSPKDKPLVPPLELWLEAASAKEIKRWLRLGASVWPLQLAHA